jgi:hypothetical protein
MRDDEVDASDNRSRTLLLLLLLPDDGMLLRTPSVDMLKFCKERKPSGPGAI